ncbi:hypothetical protein [Edaphobacter aggregans]|uniref:hypothetical protein n=1 Tax=Edaphobacter aggregans TaxID=570835 RepID=UPI001B8041A0|nr:hypothetical protein [Edaphobacter aggregans]
MPDDKLSHVHQMLEFNLNPPKPRPEMEHMQQRSMEYRQRVLRKFQENRKPGTLGTGGGTGFASMHEGTPFGRQGFHYWDEKALVHQSLQSFDGQEIEVMERLSFSPDRSTLICALEISSGGHTVRHEDGFPISQVKG